MTITTLTSREFNQDTAGAKRAAENGPVIITDRGEPAHVLLTMADYRRLTATGMSLLHAVADKSPEADFDFEPPRIGSLYRAPDLS